MKGIGILLVLVGIVLIALNLASVGGQYLAWVDTWGNSVGWGIRGGIVALGVILFLIGMGGSRKAA